jgi:drug/metabolite transporter (DMT)-like permease
VSLLAALLAALAYAGASALQGAAARAHGSTWALARSPRYLTGLALDGIAWALSLLALRGLPIYVVQAVLASSLAFTAVFAWIWQRVALRGRDVAAILVLVPALAVIALAGQEQPAPVLTGAALAGLTGAGLTVVVAAAAGVAITRRRPHRGASALALLAGLAFSVTALAGRAVEIRSPLWHTLEAPLIWVLILSGAAGTLCYAAALERGGVGAATAQLWAVEVVVPAVAAVPLLGDTIRAGWLPAAAAAVAVVVACTAVLAGSPAAR